jgi:carboxypeptidase C (cathepsin A)
VNILLLSILLATTLLAGTPHPLPASTPETKVVANQDKAGEKKLEEGREAVCPEKPVVTKHRVFIRGKAINYTATTGQLPIMDDTGKIEAHIFFIAYTAGNPGPGNRRPLLFLFNGGPGASAVWLHLGAAGPRRVRMLADGSMPPPPYQLVDNAFSWLDNADLVFIDPVGTGYSRAVKPELTKKFASVRGDIDSVGRFIRLYLTRYERWSSPLFLVGESYGTFRAAGLSEYLIERGIALNGIIMVSAVMNMETISFDRGNDLPYMLSLPGYTATAWYHKKLGKQIDLDKTLTASETWAATDYLMALTKGDRLSPGERQSIVDTLAGFTGIEKTFIENHNLRIDVKSFSGELLRKQGRMVGFMDSRFTLANPDPAAPAGFDATVATVRPPFTSAFENYVRRELGFRCDLEYFTLGGGIGRWDWEVNNHYADTSAGLINAFAKNPYMKLFVASGYFDLATPYFATEYTLAHLGLPPAIRKNITTRRYRTGHMMYLDSAAASWLKRDVEAFIKSTMDAHREGNRSLMR